MISHRSQDMEAYYNLLKNACDLLENRDSDSLRDAMVYLNQNGGIAISVEAFFNSYLGLSGDNIDQALLCNNLWFDDTIGGAKCLIVYRLYNGYYSYDSQEREAFVLWRTGVHGRQRGRGFAKICRAIKGRPDYAGRIRRHEKEAVGIIGKRHGDH